MRWLWVIALLGCGNSKKEEPPPPPSPPPKPAPVAPADAAEPVTVDLGPGTRTDWYVEAITSDKKRVLLSESTESRSLHYRVVVLATNAIEADVELPALSALPRETLRDDGTQKKVTLELDTPAIADELRRIGPLLAPFPLGAGGRIAAAPDGKHVAFNAGDWIYTAVDGKVITRVTTEAAYNPWFTPDGKALLFRRQAGTFPSGNGRYEEFATSADGKQPPRKIAGATELGEFFAVTDGTVRVISSSPPDLPTCVVELGLTAPYPVTKLGCMPKGSNVRDCVISPKGTWIACNTDTELPELDPNSTTTLPDGGVVHDHKLQFGSIWMEAATGKIVKRDGRGMASAIDDDGTFVLMGVDDDLVLIDAQGKERTIKPKRQPSLFTFFVGPKQLMTEWSGKLIVLDVH